MSHHETTPAERKALFFMFLCTAIYFVSYLTRINYGAVIIDIVAETGISARQAGLVSTAAFFTYGIGQLVSGFVGDYVKPRNLIIIGMSATAVCNIVMPMLDNVTLMMVLWGINGFCQAMFWPPLVRMMATNLDEVHYNRACIWVSAGASVATIVVYLLASICSALTGWRTLFFVGAGAAIIMVILWNAFAPRSDFADHGSVGVKKSDSKNEKAPSMLHGRYAMVLLIPLAAAIILQGILRDGVTTWLPTLVSDTFNLDSSISILSGVVLPIFSMISYNVAATLNRRFNDEVITSAILFGISALSAVLLVVLYAVNPILSVLLLAIMTGCMHGINLMLISRIPRYYDKFKKISTISGLLNAFTYVGSGLSTYLVAVLQESYGWHFTIVSWFVFAAAGGAACIAGIHLWHMFRRSLDK